MWRSLLFFGSVFAVASSDSDHAKSTRPNLEVPDQPVSEDTDVTLGCSDHGDEVYSLSLSFGQPQNTFKWEKEDSNKLTYVNHGVPVKGIDCDEFENKTHGDFRLTCDSRGFRVNFPAKPIHAGPVSCSVEMIWNPKFGQLFHSVNRTLDVTWPPSVIDMKVYPTTAREGDVLKVTCRYRLGNPQSGGKQAIVFTRAGEWTKDKPTSTFDRELNFEVHSVTWKKRMTMEDNNRIVSCSLGSSTKKTRLHVVYSPIITSFVKENSAGKVGTNITCSTICNPTPEVTVRLLPYARERREDWTREGASLTLFNAGKIIVECRAKNKLNENVTQHQLRVIYENHKAWNRHGEDKRLEVVVETSKKKDAHFVILIATVVTGVLFSALNFSLIYWYIRNKRKHEPPDAPKENQSQSSVGNDYANGRETTADAKTPLAHDQDSRTSPKHNREKSPLQIRKRTSPRTSATNRNNQRTH